MSAPSPTTSQISSSPTRPSGGESAGLPPTREAVLMLLMRQGEGCAADLAERLDVSVQVMRRHLRSLEVDGLVESSPAPEGPGRPINRWRLTDKGRGQFPDSSDDFALGLLQSMAASLPAETIRLLLHQQAIDKASGYRRRIGKGSLRQRLERLVELRREEGYVSELHPDNPLLADSSPLPASPRLAEPAPAAQPASTTNGQAGEPAGVGADPNPNTAPASDANQGWLFSEFHCSVIRLAEQFPIVCDQELQLIRHTFPDCRVERVHWRLEQGHSCGFRLIPSDVKP